MSQKESRTRSSTRSQQPARVTLVDASRALEDAVGKLEVGDRQSIARVKREFQALKRLVDRAAKQAAALNETLTAPIGPGELAGPLGDVRV